MFLKMRDFPEEARDDTPVKNLFEDLIIRLKALDIDKPNAPNVLEVIDDPNLGGVPSNYPSQIRSKFSKYKGKIGMKVVTKTGSFIPGTGYKRRRFFVKRIE